ncbi:hypothetical protein [Williamsia muralis]|uniref:Uncharacterized protein n=1 Tax=Williamsia marianensis TaxID=85044 RepID=A0ABU4EXP8_WILMA|nr:hypothetical protein [Williamsia muralis]MDV7136029.1 hypothetical protein [Williamsia muralis]
MAETTTDWRDPAQLRLSADARHSDGSYVYDDAEARRRERAAQRHGDVLR